MYISRIAETGIKQLLTTQKVIIILGPRQIGKTTMIDHLIAQKGGLRLNLDIEVDAARLQSVKSLLPKDAMQSLGNPSILAIDEAQRQPSLYYTVKGWYDSHLTNKIILLGSSSLDLLDKAAEPLTGRNEKVYLTPLTFTEILTNQSWYSPTLPITNIQDNFADQIQALLHTQLIYGSYPETVTTTDKERYLLNLVSDYLLKDVLQLGLVKSSDAIRKLLTLLAFQTGSEVSINELATNLGQSRDTIQRYIELLEKTFVIFRLHAFSTNQRKEIAKNTKVFFWDTGVRNALLKDFSMSPYRADIGALFENYVISEVAKQNLIEGERSNIYFWRTREGNEVDLVVKKANVLKAYEIKWTKLQTNTSSRTFSNLYNTPVKVVTKDTISNFLWKKPISSKSS